MPEREPMNPELAAALRAHEIEMRDGTERSQRQAFERLRQVQRRLGLAAIAVADTEAKSSGKIESGEQQLAAS
jgi:hypothetical protein